MSNYQRNTSLVICIFAVLMIGAVSIGLISYYGVNTWNWNPATTEFSFEADVGAANETVTLDINIASGVVSIVFVDDVSLLYDIDIEVQNSTLATTADPTVTFVSNTIGLDYPSAAVNLTLGSGVNYTLDIHVTSGTITVQLGLGAHVGDVSLDATSGTIALGMTDDVVIFGNATFDLEVASGTLSIHADYPTGLEGSIECAVGSGTVAVSATGWDEITPNHYESDDYSSASQKLSIIAQVDSGTLSATIT